MAYCPIGLLSCPSGEIVQVPDREAGCARQKRGRWGSSEGLTGGRWPQGLSPGVGHKQDGQVQDIVEEVLGDVEEGDRCKNTD